MRLRTFTSLIWMISLILLPFPIAAQDETPYEIALQRIEEAAARGATVLDLNGLGLTSLPPEIGQLSGLQVLYLSDNRLVCLPSEIGQLNNLRELGLRDNQLSSLPPEIGQLARLEQLYLGINRLTSLPPEIGQLSNLNYLKLGHNQLTSLPPEIGQLSNLGMPYLGGNPLQDPPPEVVARGWDAIKTYMTERAESQAQFTRMVIGFVVAMVVLLFVVRFGLLSKRGIRKKKKRG